MNDDSSSSIPLFLAVSAIELACLLSAVSLVLEEEEYIANVQVVAKGAVTVSHDKNLQTVAFFFSVTTFN
jgi:hypothetical protein